MWRVCRLEEEILASQEGLYSMQLSSQLATYIRYLGSFPCNNEEVLFLCTHKHTTLTMLSSIMQIFLQVSVLQFSNSDCQEPQNDP